MEVSSVLVLVIIPSMVVQDAKAFAVVMNCTFTSYHGPFPMPDYNFCGFQQSHDDTMNWQLAARRSGKDTGPQAAYTGSGHYAYIDSSNKDPGSYARLTSPSYTKPASDTGGCVQFYYHMYGEDIGTLNVSVYDNTQAAPVASWQKSGNQGDEWYRADLPVYLPGVSTQLHVEITVITVGVYSADNTGDIAVDEVLILVDGSCPNESAAIDNVSTFTISAAPTWSCDFEDVESLFCGADLLRFRRSVSVSDFTPSSGHNSSDHYLHMSAANLPQLTRGRVDLPYLARLYHCLTFSYHMSGQGVGKLTVSSLVDGAYEEVWSQSGAKGTGWLTVTTELPLYSERIRFEGVRGSSATSDIAIDSITLSTSLLDCSTGDSTIDDVRGVSCDFTAGLCGWTQLQSMSVI